MLQTKRTAKRRKPRKKLDPMPPTEASAALKRYAKKHKQQGAAENITEKLGRKVSQSDVSRWSSNRQVPSADAMLAMESLKIAKVRQWFVPLKQDASDAAE